MTTAITVRNLVKRLDDEAVPVTLIKGMSFNINAGEFVSIVGPSGSGKSSLMYLIGLLDSPTSGDIFFGEENTIHATHARLEELRLQRIGFVFQFHFLLPEFSALENILLPMRKLGTLSEQERIKRAQELLAYFGLAGAGHKKPGQLSGGERQRVAIARAMANNPDILLADEPTGNLDTKNADLVFKMFERLCSEQGKTVITITHDPDLASRAHRQIHIVDGLIKV